MTVTLITLAVASVLFVWNKIRADLVAMGALMALMLSGVLTPQEALSGFSDPIVIMLAGVFMVGGAVFRTGLAKRISQKLLALAGDSETRLFVLIMLVTSGIGAFVSNTGTVAVMLPIVVSLASASGKSPSRYLMPLAFASTMGGMLTLIGTTPNMIISGALVNAGYPALRFFSFLPIGLICVSVGTVVLLFLSKWFLLKKADGGENSSAPTLRELAEKYRLMENEHRARVRDNSPLVGQSLLASRMREEYGVSIVEIRRRLKSRRPFERPVRQLVPEPDTVFQARDTFLFLAPEDKVQAFAEAYGLEIISDADPRSRPDMKYSFAEIGIAELVILSTSRMVDRTVKDSGLKEHYGIRVLGIRRKGVTMLRDIAGESIKSGDSLLVQGGWKSIARLGDEKNEWVVVGQPLDAALREPLSHKAPLAAVIVALMIAAMALNALPPVSAVLLAAIGLILTGCFRNVEEAYKTVSWQSVVLVAAMLPLALALEKTGAAALASKALIRAVGGMGPYAMLALVYLAASVATLFLSNTAAAALCTPIALQAALNMDLSPLPFLYAVATAASMSLAVPFSTPPNVLVMSPGRYKFMDYVKVGAPLQILFGIIMVLALPLLFPFI